ncbi:Hypothetical_protein [Hexamita inflata]|uniref:Hypothetical_protein n=1 Tax=Hexamita inflata TaxID=28002 RepID=A0AA86RPG4_9EUKA|nr:Hypothetical protein HINF_LOCUS64883 [Hexamita inflata]
MKTITISEFLVTAYPTLQSIRYEYTGVLNEQINIVRIQNMFNELTKEEQDGFLYSMFLITGCTVFHLNQLLNTSCYPCVHSNNKLTDASSSSTQPKQTATKVLKTQALLRAALAEVCKDFGKAVPSDISDRELCLLVNKTVETDSTQKFWNRVAIFEPSKTKKQLYDFYHTSFQKALFDQKITQEDKKIIEHMNRHNPDVKPAQLADMYLFQYKKQVLKHDVVMQFVNLRRINVK